MQYSLDEIGRAVDRRELQDRELRGGDGDVVYQPHVTTVDAGAFVHEKAAVLRAQPSRARDLDEVATRTGEVVEARGASMRRPRMRCAGQTGSPHTRVPCERCTGNRVHALVERLPDVRDSVLDLGFREPRGPSGGEIEDRILTFCNFVQPPVGVLRHAGSLATGCDTHRSCAAKPG